MYVEEYQHNGFFFRKILLKILLVLAIIFLLIWIIPKFTSYKKVNANKNSIKIVEENQASVSLKEHLEKLKQASFVYYKEDKLPKNVDDVELVTLKELENEKLITTLRNEKNKVCDTKKSYVKITKLTDDYLLKVYVDCEGVTDYLLVHVGQYSYCTNTICERDDQKKDDSSQKVEEKEDNTALAINDESLDDNDFDEEDDNDDFSDTDSSVRLPVSSKAKLSNFGEWSDYVRTSCSTKAVTCAKDDFNCLKEIRLKRQTESVGTYDKEYYTTHLVLNKISSSTVNACSNYNYFTIQGTTYKSIGNYEEILSISNRQSTSNWTYKETISTTTTPNFGSDKYYKFVGADFSNCTYTCTNPVAYYYDVYVYNHPIIKVSNFTSNCTSTSSKVVNSYSVAKKKETSKREERLYATACYQSVRERNIIK